MNKLTLQEALWMLILLTAGRHRLLEHVRPSNPVVDGELLQIGKLPLQSHHPAISRY
jgi:hypothetical protein